jgi:hypothetical protein
MVALDGLYFLRHIQESNGQELENTYFFEHSVGTGSAVQLNLDFESEWLPLIQALQVADIVTVALASYNMGDLGDFSTLPVNTDGNYGDVPRKPLFTAVGYSWKLNTRAVRGGSKRIAGVPSEVANEDTITSGAYITAMEALRLAYDAPLVGAADTWAPIVVKRVKTAITGTTPTQYRYTLPVPPADATIGQVVEVLTTTALTSQVSRKP